MAPAEPHRPHPSAESDGRPGGPADPAGVVDGALPLGEALASVRPPDEVAETFRRQRKWRRHTVLHDLYRGSATHPGRPAVVAHRAHRPSGTGTVTLSYAQLAVYVDRFAHALTALGIGAGDGVAFQLPNWWEAVALFLACLRTGAVAVPVMPGYGRHDLAAVLAAAQPRVCVVPDRWEGAAPAGVLADLAPELPWLRHRVVIGDAAATGAVDFEAHFLRTPHERYHPAGQLPMPTGLADRVALIVNSAGLGEAHSMYAHSPNSLYAALEFVDGAFAQGPSGALPDDAAGSVRTGPADGSPGDVGFSPLPLATLPGLLHAVVGPLSRGGTVALQDVWDADTAWELMDAAAVTQVLAPPAHWSELLSAAGRRPQAVQGLRRALSSDAAGTSARLAAQVRATFGTPLTACAVTAAGSPQPPGSVGEGTAPGPNAASCLAVWRSETGGLYPTWAAAGDRAPAPGTPGTEVADEVGGVFLLPIVEIEAALHAHPGVGEAAVVAYMDAVHGELACAVVVPSGAPPTLAALREHLLAAAVAPAHLPARLELTGALPRDADGEVRRDRLRSAVTSLPRPTRATGGNGSDAR